MIEAYLPAGPSSWFDVAGVSAFLVLCGLTWWAIKAGILGVYPCVRRGGEFLRSRVSKFHIKIGIDFRENPPYPQRLPAPPIWLALAVAALAILGLMAPSAFPHGLRSDLTGRSPILYVAITSALWLWTGLIGAMSGFVCWVHLNDYLLSSRAPSPNRNRALIIAVVAVLIAVSVGATLVDPSVPVIAIVGILIVSLLTVTLRRSARFRVLWREAGSPDVFAFGGRWLIAWVGFMCWGVVATTCGLMTISGWHGGPGGPTVWIGNATALLGVLGAASWFLVGPIRLLRLASNDPARVRRTSVFFEGGAPDTLVVATLAVRGIRTISDHSEGSAVRVALDPNARRLHVEAIDPDADPIVWSVHPDDLLSLEVLAELRAIDRFARRQELIAGIRGLMEFAKTREFREGTGFWFAPHLWYLNSMSRDTDEADAISVGPPYHRFLSADARHHCHKVFRATSIDLVFIEDGVAFEGVEGVLGQLFDHYDLWGVEPIQERHFHTIPRVRAMIQDVAHDSPLDRAGYPEPDYDDIGRARVLHVMLDRGGADEASGDELDPVQEPLVAGIV